MLVLSRRQQECIKISDDVVITVLTIRGGTVKLGIEAPRQMRVVRTELLTVATRVPEGEVSIGVPPI